MTDSTEPIRRRALRFARTLEFENPVILDVRDADKTVVLERGSGDISQYRTVRIELQLSTDLRQSTIEHAGPNDADELKRVLEARWIYDITCSATDIILVDIPSFID